MMAEKEKTVDLYSVLADYYDEIFPLDHDAVETAVKNLPRGTAHAKILDIGSATGSLAGALSRLGHPVTGIDNDPKMVALSRSSCSSPDAPVFIRGDMLSIEKIFSPNSFDLIVCFGNTLVHLPDTAAVGDFFSQARRLLARGGRLVFQILNYDHILDAGVRTLPVIETAHLAFTRRYLPRKDGRLDFSVTLSLKETGEVLHGLLPLHPLRMREISGQLALAGFTRTRYYGDFRLQPYESAGMMLIGSAVP